MEIQFSVGERETHTVEFAWGQMLGSSRIAVDGLVVFRGRPVALEEVALLAHKYRYLYEIVANRNVPWHRIRSWDLEVGDREKHYVRIEKERPLLLAALRPHAYRVYVDGALVVERRGY